MMSTEKVPELPTREEEKSYMKWLLESFSSDPWLTVHPKLYSAGPHRLYFKYWVDMKKEYRRTFWKNFIVSTVACWPLIIL